MIKPTSFAPAATVLGSSVALLSESASVGSSLPESAMGIEEMAGALGLSLDL